MKHLPVLATATVVLLSTITAGARPIGNPRNLSSNAPTAVHNPTKKAGLTGFLFRKKTTAPKGSKIVPRRGKQTPGRAKGKSAPKPKKGGLLSKLFSRH